MSKLATGFILVFLASLFVSTANVVTKYIYNSFAVNPETLSLLWFSSAFIVSSIILLLNKDVGYMETVRKHWKPGLLVGLTTAIAVITWFNAIDMIGPNLVGFVTRFEIIFTIMLGILLLKERLTKLEIVGMFVAIAGAFLITFGAGRLMVVGIILAGVSSMAVALQNYFVKRFVRKIHPAGLIVFRTFYTLLFLVVYTFALNRFQPVDAGIFKFVIVGSTISAVLGHLMFYSSLRYIDMAKAATVRAFDAFIVVVYSFILFATIPDLKQMIGGTMVILGVLVTTSFHRLLRKQNARRS